MRCYLFTNNVVTRVTCCKMNQCPNFLPGARILYGYSLVTRWLLIHALLQLLDAASHEVPN